MTFSRRSAKYVWLCLPGLFGLALTCAWGASVAPSSQSHSMAMIQWRREKDAIRQKQDYLAKNPVHSDYSQLVFSGLAGVTPAETKDSIQAWVDTGVTESYADGQIVRLLNNTHHCIGYLVAGKGVYLSSDGSDLCAASIEEIPEKVGGSFSDIELR